MTRPLELLRDLLGLVLLLSALGYFLPMFFPSFAPDWTDPMAARLMAQLEASGLLAVAKFIHVVAGVGLLLNRAVPFLLASAISVNVCAAFIAVVVEGEPVGAILALLILAINALLMFAYLPAYSDVLARGAIADGEGAEAGAHYDSLFVNPLSGASRKQCLIALLPLLAAAAFYWKAVLGLNSVTGLAVLVVPTLALLVNLVRAKG